MALWENIQLSGAAKGHYRISTSVTVSGSTIYWTASVQKNDDYVGTNWIGLSVYECNKNQYNTNTDPSTFYGLPTVGYQETSSLSSAPDNESNTRNVTFSGSFNASKSTGDVVFVWKFNLWWSGVYSNFKEMVMIDSFNGATPYEPPSCSISIQSGSSFTPNGVVTLKLSCSGTIQTGLLRRFYRASTNSIYTSQDVRSQLVSPSTTITERLTDVSSGGQVYWDYTVSDGNGNYASRQTSPQTITSNSAPTAPETLTIPNTITADEEFDISWSESTDNDGNLAGYLLERSFDRGSSWETVQKVRYTVRETKDTVPPNNYNVRYRVRAYDTLGLYSPPTYAPSSGDRSVVNNRAPTAPIPITLSPVLLSVGNSAVISWGASTDPDGDSFKYYLERAINNSTTFEPIWNGTSTSYTDTVGSWTNVKYRVKAVDSHNAASDYVTLDSFRAVVSNTAPTLSVKYSGDEVASGADVGTFSSVFNLVYQVNDTNTSDTLVVKEIVDGIVRKTVSSAVRGQDYTFAFTNGSNVSYWNTILNGSHTVTISVTDGKETVSKSVTFLKSVGACTITLATAITASANIESAAVSICGDIPAGGLTAVQVTADNGTHWENCVLVGTETGYTESGLGDRKKKATGPSNEKLFSEELLGGHYLFIHEMTNTGNKFNFRVQAQKVGDVGGFISSVQGTFIEAAAT